MKRSEIIEKILTLHKFTWLEYDRIGLRAGDLNPVLTCEWFMMKPTRFYIVEDVSHREEEFSASVKVHYGIRSGERKTISNGYGNSVNTFPIDVEYIYNMTLDEAKVAIKAEFEEYVEKREKIT